MSEGFWDDYEKAQKVTADIKMINDLIDEFEYLNNNLIQLNESCEFLKQDFDQELMDLVEIEYLEINKKLDSFEIKVLLSHEYDKNDCILEIHPGAGGTESCDWTQMLYRMYTRFCEKHNYKVKILNMLPGDEAGIKSVTMEISGNLAYGMLKSERGVHRLVRISPFDASGRRHTSFASVEVMPKIDNAIDIDLEDKDLKIETMRASGAGGQHINKTDSAVRITHLPTGISVKCQDGRSQIQNREQAMMLLKAKLYQKKIEEQEKEVAMLKGEQQANEWGSQIRSYVFHPYTMVKDHRTNYQTSQGDDVLDGEIDDFIFNYLKKQI